MVLNNRIRMQIADVDPKVVPEGESPSGTAYNFFQGRNPSNWHTNVRMFGAVRLSNIYPGISAVFTTSTMARFGVFDDRGNIILTIQPGADMDRFRLRVLNTGTIPFAEPGQVWFVGGNVSGTFIVSVQASQIDGDKRVPIDSNLKIESPEILSVQAAGRNPALTTEVKITFPDYGGGRSIQTVKAADGSRYAAFQVDTPTDFGEDGKLDVPACSGRCTDAILTRLDDNGNPIWVSLFGGEGIEYSSFAAPSSNGVVVSGTTWSQDFPVTSNAPQPTLRSPPDAFLAFFDRDSGQLRNATYAGLQGGVPYQLSYAVDPGGDFAICGFVSDAATTSGSGYLLRWRPSENRFAFSLRFDTSVESIVFGGDSKLFFASTERPLPGPRLNAGVVDASGQQQGSLVPIDVQPANNVVQGIRLLPGTEGGFWVAYEGIRSPGIRYPGVSDAPTIALAEVSPTRSEVIFNRPIAAGYLGDLAFTPAGNIKLLVQLPSWTQATSVDAPLVAGCTNTSYFLILSPSGQTVYASYVPAAFDFASQNEIQDPAPASLSCFASTAGRFPSTSAAPGQLITVTGGGFGPSGAVYGGLDANGRFPLTLGGFSVRIAGMDAHIIAVARGLITAQVPYELMRTSVPGTIEVFNNGLPLNPIPISIFDWSFALFDTGDRNNALNLPALAALNQDGTVNSQDNPAPAGSIVSLFGSGLGTLSPGLASGGLSPIPPAGPLSQSSLLRTCLGGEILYLGSAPGLSTSVVQANVRLAPEGSIGGVHGIGIAVSGSSKGLVIFSPAGIVFVK